MSRCTIRLSFVLLFVFCSSSAIGAAEIDDDLSSGYVIPTVSTVAGDGELGFANGAALHSSFMEPSGVAVAPDGSIYVADASAQQIRRIQNGVTTLVAGRSEVGLSGLSRVGGYMDGTLSEARFNRPMGLAVSNDGSIYVADSLNHCIRKISKGEVTTFAGTGVVGSADGPAQMSSFNLPLDVASDDVGNIYVADFKNGVRKIDTSGIVSTLNLPTDSKRDVFGISVRGSGSGLRLAWTSLGAIYFSARSTLEVARFDSPREPHGENLFTGFADRIAIVGLNSVVITDLTNDAVRFVQMYSEPLDDSIITRSLAGGIREGSPQMSGYRDGPSSIAEVNEPTAVAQARDGSLFVADAGNRRVRQISPFDTRGPVLGDYSNLYGPKETYKIVVVGNSLTFSNVLWGESISGQIEAGLNRDRSTIGLMKKVSVSAVRISAASISIDRQFVEDYLGDSQADLVIFLINPFNHNTELDYRPDLRKNDSWKSIIPSELSLVARDLASNGTKLVLVTSPEGQLISRNEVSERALESDGLSSSENEMSGRSDAMISLDKVYATSGVRIIPLVSKMQAYERTEGRVALFNTNDIHFTVAGSIWLGRHILQGIEQMKPWRQ